jgi:hypothetical protein
MHQSHLEWFRVLRATKPATPLELLTTICAGVRNFAHS